MKKEKVAKINVKEEGGKKAPEMSAGSNIPRVGDIKVETPKITITGLGEKRTKAPDNSKFVPYGESVPTHPFPHRITVTAPNEPFVGYVQNAIDDTINIPLDIVNYISLQSTVDDIQRELKSRFNIIKKVEFDTKYNAFIAELKLAKCLKKEDLVTVTDFNKSNPLKLVDESILTDELKSILHPNYKKINTRGNELALVIGTDELIGNVLLKSYMLLGANANKDLKLEKHVTLSNTEYKNNTLFYLYAFKEMPKDYTFICARANFVAVNVSCSTDRAAELMNEKVVSKLDAKSGVKFIEAAPIYKENDEHSPILKKEYINGRAESIMETVPMVKLSESFKSSKHLYKNPLMNSLVKSQENLSHINTSQVRAIFKTLIPQGTVMSYMVDGEPYLLVDSRVLFAKVITESIYNLKASIVSQDNKVAFILHI